MKKSRLHYSIINSSYTLIIQSINLFLKFLLQTIFIKTLGAHYLGVNGLFTNILSLLSFAELGIGDAIVFSLYSPLANGDKKQVKYLMGIFKKAYELIGITVGLLGLALLPCLSFFIKGQSIPYLHLVFSLFLLNTVLSYFFTYKRSLLIADQLGYLSNLNQFIFNVVQVVFQLIILIFTGNYILYLVVQIICTLTSNIIISHSVNKRYPYMLDSSINTQTNNRLVKQLKQNTIGMVGVKLGGIVVFGTDNLLISAFLGVVKVGIYSNYSLITTSISNVLNQVINSIVPSIGNLIVDNQRDREVEVFYRHFFINFVVTFLCTNMLFSLLTPFITLWIGSRYLLSITTTSLIVINFSMNQLRQTSITFISAFGLFWQTKWKSIIEAAVNFLVSIVLIMNFHLGIDSVLLGTLSSNLLIDFWWEPLLVFKYGLRSSIRRYYVRYFEYAFFIFIAVFLTNSLEDILFLADSPIQGFIGRFFFTLIISMFLLLFWKGTSESKYFWSVLKRTILKRL